MSIRVLLEKEFLIYRRASVMGIAALIAPLVYLFVFGATISGAVAPINGVQYVSFILPGIMMVTIVYSSVLAGASVFVERRSNTLLDLLSLPLGKASILFARLIVTSFLNALKVLVLFLVAVLTVASDIGLHIGSVVLVPVAAFLVTMSLNAFAIGAASLFEKEQHFNAVANLVVLPSIFLSTAFYPKELMPEYVRIIAEVNPVSAGADVFRHILLGTGIDGLKLAIFLLFTIIGMYLMLRNWGRYLKG